MAQKRDERKEGKVSGGHSAAAVFPHGPRAWHRRVPGSQTPPPDSASASLPPPHLTPCPRLPVPPLTANSGRGVAANRRHHLPPRSVTAVARVTAGSLAHAATSSSEGRTSGRVGGGRTSRRGEGFCPPQWSRPRPSCPPRPIKARPSPGPAPPGEADVRPSCLNRLALGRGTCCGGVALEEF